MFFGSFKFSAVFPQLRRNKIEVERAIKTSFISNFRNRNLRFFLARFRIDRRGSKPILVERPTALQRATAHLDVVLFAAGEVVEREWVLGRAHDAQIALDPGA